MLFKTIACTSVAIMVICVSLSAQEPTKDEWITSFQNQKKNDRVSELTKKFIELRDAKVPGNERREKQAKVEKARAELIAEKKKLWSQNDVRYPQIDVYGIKKGDVGVMVTSLSDLTGNSPRSSPSSDADVADYLSAVQEMNTRVQSYKVFQVLGPKDFLCNCGKTTVLVSGVDTSDMRDGKSIEKLGLIYCVGNATYPTKNGPTTVMKVVPVSSQVADRLTNETKAELATSRVRTWTDSTGTHKTEAELVDFDGKKITIKKNDGTKSVLPIGKVSKEDREYAIETLGAPDK